MSEYDDPLESSGLDLSSDPLPLNKSAVSGENSQRKQSARRRRQPVRLYFGCCKVFAHLTPPEHVLHGEADIWRAHCPRCGGLVEVLFE